MGTEIVTTLDSFRAVNSVMAHLPEISTELLKSLITYSQIASPGRCSYPGPSSVELGNVEGGGLPLRVPSPGKISGSRSDNGWGKPGRP